MIYVDNPIGTGFSIASEEDLVTNEDQVAEGLHNFLKGFLKANPEFEGRELFITGESYAGHYIPAISYELVTNGKDLNLNFKGSAIGNGWVDPYHQYPAYAKYAYENHLVNGDTYRQMEKDFKTCQYLLKN